MDIKEEDVGVYMHKGNNTVSFLFPEGLSTTLKKSQHQLDNCKVISYSVRFSISKQQNKIEPDMLEFGL